jgi:hypothetical protein
MATEAVEIARPPSARTSFHKGNTLSEHATERRIPLILIAAGLVMYAIAAVIHAGPAGVAPVLFMVVLGGIVQTILLLVAAFLVAMFLKVSFGDMNAAVLKFAGATLASGGLGAIIPVGGIVAAVVFLALIL